MDATSSAEQSLHETSKTLGKMYFLKRGVKGDPHITFIILHECEKKK